MEIDYNLIRDILLTVEDLADGNQVFDVEGLNEVCSPETSYTAFAYHLKYLYDAGFIEAEGDDYVSDVVDITPLGREYISNIREDSIWEAVQERLRPFSNPSLEIVSATAASIIKSRLGV